MSLLFNMLSGLVITFFMERFLTLNLITLIDLGSKITVGGDCSHEIKMLTPWKESYDQPR